MVLALAGFGMIASIHAAEGPETFDVAGLKFKRPAKWEWIEPSSSMRKAQMKVTEGKDSAEVVFFFFGGNGGGTQANIQRWLGQFVEPRDEKNTKVEEKTVGGIKVTYVHAEGTYQSGMPGGPKTPLANHMLVGAIVEAKEGFIFIRLTGPKELASKSEKDFHAMVESGLK